MQSHVNEEDDEQVETDDAKEGGAYGDLINDLYMSVQEEEPDEEK